MSEPQGLTDARRVFLAGCGLLPGTASQPALWASQPRWQVLDTGFGAGWAFLATWQAWHNDPQRPQHLFYTAIDAQLPSAEDMRLSAQPFPEWHALAHTLAEAWCGLLPGTHRLVFDEGRVQLTLHIGLPQEVLPTLDSPTDSVFLCPSSASPTDSDDTTLAKGVGRLCRVGTRLACTFGSEPLAHGLTSAGFDVEPMNTAASAQRPLQARYAPRWSPRHSLRSGLEPRPSRVVVVGAGLAGSAVAWSLAQRGWQVDVLDQASEPATGASALPIGVVAPHASPDDAMLSRLSRSGVRLTLQRAAQLLPAGLDWAASGVLEHRVEGKRGLPATDAWAHHGQDWSRTAHPDETARAHLPVGTPGLWHSMAGWIRPAQLVRAQLQHPAIHWQGGCQVHTLQRKDGHWHVLDAQGQTLAHAEHVVLAAAYPTRALLAQGTWGQLPLNPLRGQISCGPLADLPAAAHALLPPFPVNGHGSFVHDLAQPGERPAIWVAGSTFERGATEAVLKPEDNTANQVKLARLLPALELAMSPAWETAQGWAGVRCTLPDRLPAVGPVDAQAFPGLHVCTGLGARGLTLSVLCGEMLAALLHGEPWPTERKLAQALLAERFRAGRQSP